MLILGRAFSDKFSVIYQDASMTGIRFIFKDISEIQNPHLRELVKDGGFRRSIKNSDPPTTIVYLSQHLRDEARARAPYPETPLFQSRNSPQSQSRSPPQILNRSLSQNHSLNTRKNLIILVESLDLILRRARSSS